ncbi:MAG: hypothetical protein OSB09_02835 [Planctomycetota bacterium]|nr:hypothetical protein [Planctomycetota bacterium]
MLSLSTSLLPESPLSLAEQVCWLLDGGIPGIVVGAEIDRERLAALVQEVDGAGHCVTALEAPRPHSSARNQHPRQRCPALSAIEEAERRLAVDSLLDALELADRYQIALVVVSPSHPGGHDPTADCHQLITETQLKIDRAGSPDDPATAAQVKQWVDQQRQQLMRLTRPDGAAQQRQQKARDSMLRSLDTALERAAELGIALALRESDRIGGFTDRSGFLDLYQIFRGAPLRFMPDPAAAELLSTLLGLKTVTPLPEDLELIEGCYLRDRLDLSFANLGDGDLDLSHQFGNYGAEDLRIIELSKGTTSQQVREVASLCRALGIDGSPPPQPGDPFPIIGG